jgi:hypothetical protein
MFLHAPPHGVNLVESTGLCEANVNLLVMLCSVRDLRHLDGSGLMSIQYFGCRCGLSIGRVDGLRFNP